MKLKLFSISFLLVILSCFLEINAKASTTFNVNSNEDLIDINPGDCFCVASNQLCTLRAAVIEANACAGADIIELPADTYVLSITGTGEDLAYEGDLDITEDVTINGEGASTTIVDADKIDRVFHVFDGTVSFNGFTIQNGDGRGGGSLVEFSDSASTFSLDKMNVSSNSSGYSGGALFISEAGFLYISDSTFENNTSFFTGNIYISSSSAEIKNSSFSGNGSSYLGYGSVVYVTGTGSEVTISQSTFDSNNSSWADSISAIYNDGQSLSISYSTISNNAVGGLCASGGTTWVFNSTISGNTGYFGGGISGDVLDDDSVFYISHSTITNNTGYAGGSPVGGGGLYRGTFYLKGTIVIGNTSAYTSNEDCATDATIVSEDYNWFDSDECPTMTPSSNDVDEPYDSAYLESLADNGGPTETHAITTDSPAHNAGTCYDLDDDRVSFDQRGHLRIRKCDIGAYEIGPEMKIPTFPLGGGVIIH